MEARPEGRFLEALPVLVAPQDRCEFCPLSYRRGKGFLTACAITIRKYIYCDLCCHSRAFYVASQLSKTASQSEQCWAVWRVQRWLLTFQKAQSYLWFFCALWVSLRACGLDLALGRGCNVFSVSAQGPGYCSNGGELDLVQRRFRLYVWSPLWSALGQQLR